MNPKLFLPAILAAAAALIAPTLANAQIAVTEFLANPRTVSDNDGEFVELFNYGTETVNLLSDLPASSLTDTFYRLRVTAP